MSHSIADQHAPPGPGQTSAPKADNQPLPPNLRGRARRWPWIVALLVVFLAGYLIGHKFGNAITNTKLAAIPTLAVSTTVPVQTSVGTTTTPIQVSGGTIAPTQVGASTTTTQTGGSTTTPTQTSGGTIVPNQVSGSTSTTSTSIPPMSGSASTTSTFTPPTSGSASTTSTSTPPTSGSASTTQAPTAPISYLFSSKTGGDTEAFIVLPNWVLQWTCNPASLSSIGQYNLLVNVMSGSDGTPIDPLAVNTVCKVGNTSGQINEMRGGTVYLDIDTEGAWTVTVQQQAA